jgi:type IV secretory pathway TraG/TraD family ATPase VirD4
MLPTHPDYIVIYFYAGFLLLAPVFIVLHTWDSCARPLGQNLIKTTERCIWYAIGYLFGIGAALTLCYVIVLWRYGNPFAGYSHTVLYFAGLIGSALWWLAAWWYGAQSAYLLTSPQARADEKMRGAEIADGRERQLISQEFRARCAHEKKRPATVRLCGVELPRDAELEHFLILGTTGSGKTTMMHGLIYDIAERAKFTGERMFVLDPNGNFMERHFSPARGDLFWNPFVPGSVSWNPLCDLDHPWDADNMAANLVPDHHGPDSHWSTAARIIISAALTKLRDTRTDADANLLRELCVTADLDTQREFFADTDARKYFADGAAAETIASYQSNLSNALTPLRYLPPGGDFSFSRWVRGGRGWLFLPYTAGQIAAIRPLFRIAVRAAIFSCMDLPKFEDAAQRRFRLWHALDEFDALGRLDGLTDALPRLRGHGCPVILGAQTSGQFSAHYGQGFEAAIKENAKTRVIMNVSAGDDHSTAEFASRLIGQRQVRRFTASTSATASHGTARGGDTSNRAAGASTQEHRPIEPLVLPSELEQLAKGEAYLRISGEAAWMRLRSPKIELPMIDNPFTRFIRAPGAQPVLSIPAGEK